MWVRIILTISAISETYDEPRYLKTAQRLSEKGQWETETDVLHPPLSHYLYGFPLKILAPKNFENQLFIARLIMSVFSLILGFFIFRVAENIGGLKTAVPSLLLYTFSPAIIANSCFIATDILLTCFLFLSVHYFGDMLDTHLPKDPVQSHGGGRSGRYITSLGLSGILTGMVLLSKYNGVFVFPIYFLLGVIKVIFPSKGILPDGGNCGKKGVVIRFWGFMKIFLIVSIIGIFILNLGYKFTGTGSALANYPFRSKILAAMSQVPVLSRLPMPVPSPYLYGFDIQKYPTEVGHPSYLMGQRSTKGWWYYPIVAFLIKTPISFLCLLFLSLVLFVFEIKKMCSRSAVFLLGFLLIIVALCIPFVFSKSSQVGRFLLPVYPFLFVFVGTLFSTNKRVLRGISYSFLFLFLLESVSIHPNYLAYFNQLIGGPRNGYKYLADANLDWGQNQKIFLKFRKKCIREKIEVKVNPEWPTEGKVLVNANNLVDCFRVRERYEWLRKFNPVDNMGFTWLLYDIKLAELEDKINEHTDDPNIYYVASFIYREKKDYIKTENTLKKAISIELKSSDRDNLFLAKCYYLMGFMYLDTRDFLQAKKSFEKVIEAYPFFYEAFAKLSQIYDLSGNKKIAKEYSKKEKVYKILDAYAIKPPTDKKFYMNKLKVNPRDPKLYNNLGFVHWMNNNIDAAIENFNKALKLDPKLNYVYGNLAVAHYEKNDFDEMSGYLKIYYDRREKLGYRNTYAIWYNGDLIIMEDNILAVLPEEYFNRKE